MFASAANERPGARDRQRRRPTVEEPPAAPIPPAYRALAAVSAIRRARAERTLAHAERDLRRLSREHANAQAQWAQSRQSAVELEGDWHRSHLGSRISGRDILAARAMQAERERQLKKQAEALHACAKDAATARDILVEARRTYGASVRKAEKLRVLRQRLEQAGGLSFI
ncbi:hypothetical protein C0Z18_10815 [Trinickia dabaoshanensis]|uniref:Uncharacterized protein n=2 Tax=Trinickia dabaoshanensis TaxID=564714 RepID=A0A2N7VTF7_9BURK|nr:hypothetical protein C0Z18_10815 [Trinickia dabaoshanensis]